MKKYFTTSLLVAFYLRVFLTKYSVGFKRTNQLNGFPQW